MNRCQALVEAMAKQSIQAALITAPENIRYLTGYTGEGALLVGAGAALILTDFRYVEQAKLEAPECELFRTTAEDSMEAGTLTWLTAHGFSTLAIDMGVTSVRQMDALTKAMPGITFVDLPKLVESARAFKSEEEYGYMVDAAKIACAAFDELIGILRPGMTEKEVRAELNYAMARRGSEKPAFDTIVASGPNGSRPHASAMDRRLRSGELLTLDFGAQVNGYKCDMTRTVAIGAISDELRALYEAVRVAQQMALDAVAPGVPTREVDRIARDYLDARYPGAFGHSLGHAVGLLIHENPRLSPTSDAVLTPGHVVTVEPGVYLEGFGGCRIEDMVLITPTGYLNPITAPKHLITV